MVDHVSYVATFEGLVASPCTLAASCRHGASLGWCVRTKAIAFALLAAGASSAAAIDLQGHRGTRGLAPENTLAAVRTALAVGVPTLETDLAMTRDGVLVLSHDPHLSAALTRGSDGRWLSDDGASIFSLSARDLAQYDVGRLNPAHK